MILIRQPWTRQPQVATRVAGRFSDGIKVAFNSAVGGGRVNLISPPDQPTVSGTVVSSVASNGRAFKVGDGGNTDGIYWPTTSAAANWSLLISMEVHAVTSLNGYLQWSNTSAGNSNPRFLLQVESTSNMRIFMNGYAFSEAGVGTVGSRHTVVCRYDGTTLSYYRNGIKQSGARSSASTGTHIWFGNGYQNGGRCHVFAGAWWEKTLSDGDAMALSINPWQLFQPINRRLYFDVAAAAETLWAQSAL